MGGWTFRCAVLKFILKASTKPTNVPADAVLEILCFKPDFRRESPKSGKIFLGLDVKIQLV